MLSHLVLAYLLLAQESPLAFPPPAAGITVASDVAYGTSGTTRLAMDVYKPAPGGAARMPALVFFNRATGAERSGRFYAGWARAAASKGIIAILPDLRSGSETADFRLLMSYLEQHGSEHGIDAIAVYAGSGNVFNAFPAVEDPKQTAIKAAVMYYGSAPVTLLNYAGGHHAFEIADDTAATREVIDQTLEFVKRATSAPYQAALRASLGEATAAGYVQTRKFREAVAEYTRMVASRPADARLRLAYGEALLGDGQYATACAEFDTLRDKGLGYRDLGLPAARACAQKGDADAAIAWLNSIPARFLPASVGEEPAFAALKNRPDFQAIFARR
jgi:hypothetical protein